MRNMTDRLVPLAALVGATMFSLPGAASGQEVASTTLSAAPEAGSAVPEITVRDASAWKGYAVELVREAAALPAGSAEKVQMIRTAAMIRLNFGEAGSALKLMVDAAEEAATLGSVALAAHTFIDGAWIAAEMELPGQVNQLAERAVMLTISPLMADTDRMAVLRRVERTGPGNLAAR